MLLEIRITEYSFKYNYKGIFSDFNIIIILWHESKDVTYRKSFHDIDQKIM